MLVVYLVALMGLHASVVQASKYDEVSWYTRYMLAGQLGVLGQGVRIPSRLFEESPCQLVYLASPDWATSLAYVDFGSSKYANGCKKQAFLVYVDGYYEPRNINGIGSNVDVPWAGILTAPASMVSASYSSSEANPHASTSAGSESPVQSSSKETLTVTRMSPHSRRWWTSAIDIPLDRVTFSSKYDALRDNGVAQSIMDSGDAAAAIIPGVDGPLSRPTCASAWTSDVSNIPADPRPYLDIVEKQQQQQQSNGSSSSDDETMELAGMISGRLRVYSPLPQECLDALHEQRKQATVIGNSSGTGTSSGGPSTWNPILSEARDSCFVTQQAILIYNDCPATTWQAAASRITGNSSSSFPSDCSTSPVVDSGIACLLERSLLEQSASMKYNATDADVRVTVLYKPYSKCYRNASQRLGQAGCHLIFWTAAVIVLVVFVLLVPTLFRMFISFPIRCIVYFVKQLLRRDKAIDPPLATGLHSYKEPVHWRCFQLPVIRHLLGARKHLLYAMCTIYSADGQYRALQVSVTSSVALMICMMSFPPRIIPYLEYFIPPLNFRIDRVSGDPLSNVWYFLTILAYSLYLGFIGYLAMLSNSNRPGNKYYLTQCSMSAFFMLVLDALVLMQVYSILIYWDRLSPKWPWLPIATFQLANLVVSNVTLLVTLFSHEDRNVSRRRAEYWALMEELRDREAHLARVRTARGKQPAATAVAVVTTVACTDVTDNSHAAATAVERRQLPSDSSNSSSLRRRAVLPLPQPQPPSAAAAAEDQSRSQGRQRHRPSDAAGSVQQGSVAGPLAEGVDNRVAEIRVRDNPLLSISPQMATEGSAVSPRRNSNFITEEAKEFAASPSAQRMSRLMSLISLRRRWREQQSGSAAWAAVRRFLRPLSEDSAFRYPSWLLAALFVSGYMLIFMYARTMNWAHVIAECIADPAECLNNNMARYMIFTTRLLGRDWQVRVRDTLDAVVAAQGDFRGMVEGALSGNSTMPGFGATVDMMAANLTTAVVGAASNQLSAALTTDVSSLLNETLGPQLTSLIPEDQTATFQVRLAEMVAARVSELNLSAVAAPVASSVQEGLLRGLNATVSQFFTGVDAISNVLRISINVTHGLEHWKRDLENRFFWCSLVGFTLGLLLGLSSLVRTAISFRTAARKLRLARIAGRVLSSHYEADAEGGGGKWAVTNFNNIYDADDSIVRRSEATGIALVVFFFGVLLSTAIVQLYAVGISLSIALALLTHPWTWTWLLPRYYMWLVAIIIGILLNKVVLINFIGNTWLSNGDHIYRPAAWLAFLVIASATNLVIGQLLAVYRIVLLLLTTIFALGKLDVTLFTLLAKLDLPHSTFLAGLHLQESMSKFHDTVYLPGPRGRAHRRWRKLREAVSKCGGEKLRQLIISEPLPGGKVELMKGTPHLAPSVEDQVMVTFPDPGAMMAEEAPAATVSQTPGTVAPPAIGAPFGSRDTHP